MVVCDKQSVRKYFVQYISVLVATLGMVSDGMQFAWPSPAIPKLLQEDSPVSMTKDEAKWITQYYIMGNIAGVIVSFLIFNRRSRKLSIFISCLPILASWIGILTTSSLTVLYVARFVGGVGRNMAYVVVPIYIGEIAAPNIRGILGTFMYIMMNIGVLMVYAMTPYLPLYVPPVVGIVLVAIQILVLKLVPESPYYLLMNDREDEARRSLMLLRSSKDVEDELKSIKVAVERQTQEKSRFSKLFTTKSNRKALGILLVLRGIQTLSGVSVMTMHIHLIFREAGGNISSEFSAIVYALMMLSSCVLSMATSDRFGRKPLMIFSCWTTALILASQGAFFYSKLSLDLNTDGLSWLPVVFIVLFVLAYRVGLGTVPIVMISELFPANVKAYGIVLTDLMYSVASLLSNTIFTYTEDAFGMYTPFWIYATFCLAAAVFSKLCVPETKAKTLEEIQFILMNRQYEATERNRNNVAARSN